MTILLSYSIPADPSNWCERIEAACRVIEGAFGVRLAKASPYRTGRVAADVLDRQSFLRKKGKSRTRWVHLFSAPACERSDDDGHCAIGGCSYANKDVYNFSAQFPDVDDGRVEALLVALGDAVSAYSAHYSPARTARRLNAIHWRPAAGVVVPPAFERHFAPQELQLPRLVHALYEGLASPLQPHALGWLNYWSDETAGYIGFPDPRRDGDLLRNARRTPAGAWLVKICEEPLDAARSDHLALLAGLYERFPRLAVRASQA